MLFLSKSHSFSWSVIKAWNLFPWLAKLFLLGKIICPSFYLHGQRNGPKPRQILWMPSQEPPALHTVVWVSHPRVGPHGTPCFSSWSWSGQAGIAEGPAHGTSDSAQPWCRHQWVKPEMKAVIGRVSHAWILLSLLTAGCKALSFVPPFLPGKHEFCPEFSF